LREDGNLKIKIWFAVILACVIPPIATLGQQSTASRPADSGPPLAATMQIVQSLLNEPGKLNWTTHFHDSADNTNWIYQFIFEVNKVVANASACTIAYHYSITRDGSVIADTDASFNLHDVQDLTLTTGDQRQNKNDTAAGNPTWNAKVDPSIFDLVVRGQGTAEYYFIFRDEDTANRATKAMGHAVELCGGSRGSF
jgi:hypothetical protein